MKRVGVLMPGYASIWCPGCDCAHTVEAHGPAGRGWNSDVENPSFRLPIEREGCRMEVEAGFALFDMACTHALAGRLVPLPEWKS